MAAVGFHIGVLVSVGIQFGHEVLVGGIEDGYLLADGHGDILKLFEYFSDALTTIDLAVVVAGKAMGNTLDDNYQRKLIDEALKEANALKQA